MVERIVRVMRLYNEANESCKLVIGISLWPIHSDALISVTIPFHFVKFLSKKRQLYRLWISFCHTSYTFYLSYLYYLDELVKYEYRLVNNSSSFQQIIEQRDEIR